MDPVETPAAEAQPTDAPEAVESSQGADAYHGLYDLSAAPEELRPLLEAELKKVTANVGRRLEDHANYRKRYEALDGIDGLTDVPPDELKELLEFRQVAGDQEQFEAWWSAVGEELGFLDGDAGAPESDDLGGDDPAGQVGELRQLVESLQERLDNYETQGQTEKAREQAKQDIDRELAALTEQHGEFDQGLVLRLARDYASEPDAIQRGYEDYLRVTGQAQSELVEDKLDQPTPANRGGRPDTTTPQITTFDQAKEAALQRLGG